MVQYAWLVPAFPLAAMVIVFFITKPLEAYTSQRHAAGHQGQQPHGGAAESEAHGHDQGMPPGSHDSPPAIPASTKVIALPTEEETRARDARHAREAHDDGGGHGHGGRTSLWGSIGSWIGVLAMVLSFALSIAILIQYLGDATLRNTGYTIHLYDWISYGPLQWVIAFRIDTLTVVMLVVVTGVSMLVNFYSMGYMAGDAGYSRFFIELAIFTVSMLILVLGANFLILYIGWELVGLSSYLLIGFWFDHAPPPPDSEVPYPPPAQVKAFVTTRLGDFAFLIGILILFTTTGTFNFIALNSATKSVDVNAITVAMILVFCGAVGKSAQFPLYTWLPDAMAGPTPVSALIHAATMVAAGVYLVARLFPIYYSVAGPQALLVVGYVGGFTACYAATIALVQNDIKGVLAYSTISQLGYMFVGLAMTDTNSAGMFHLFTHAFFKALLFLGAGSVIHAVGQQDMRRMGGLARFLPVTAFCFLIATLAISGIPPFSGFWSKDPIIGAAFERGNYILYGLTLFTALLTAFYMFRLFFMSFGGRGGGAAGFWGGNFRGEGHPHESPITMTLPLIVLAATSVGVGFWSINNGFANFIDPTAQATTYVSPFADPLTYIGIAASVLGIIIAWSMYGAGIVRQDVLIRNPVGRVVYRVLRHGYYVNELYHWLIYTIVFGISKGFVWFDLHIIDGIADGSAKAVRGLGSATSRSQTGFLQNYGAALFGGAMLLMIAVFIAVVSLS